MICHIFHVCLASQLTLPSSHACSIWQSWLPDGQWHTHVLLLLLLFDSDHYQAGDWRSSEILTNSGHHVPSRADRSNQSSDTFPLSHLCYFSSSWQMWDGCYWQRCLLTREVPIIVVFFHLFLIIRMKWRQQNSGTRRDCARVLNKKEKVLIKEKKNIKRTIMIVLKIWHVFSWNVPDVVHHLACMLHVFQRRFSKKDNSDDYKGGQWGLSYEASKGVLFSLKLKLQINNVLIANTTKDWAFFDMAKIN